MINKKVLLPLLMLFILSTFAYADAGKTFNFVSLLNGSDTSVTSSSKNYSFVGQSIVFDTKETADYTSQSAFASIFRITQSNDISFTNNTGSEAFTDINVPLNVTIKTTASSNIVKIKYRIWQGENADWSDYEKSPEHVWTGFTPGTTVTFSPTISFTEGKVKNYFRVYAMLEDDTTKRWSDDYTVNIAESLSETIEITSPEKLYVNGEIFAITDPLIETKEYSINLTTATVALYEGTSSSGTEIYSVDLYPETNSVYKMYNTDTGKISYTHSDFIKIYNQAKGKSLPTTLKDNKVYTLVITTKVGEDSVIGSDSVTFKALGGGVADVLTYPSPFNPKKERIKIRYLLAKDSSVTIKIYDKAGKFVAKVIQSQSRNAGVNEDEWDGRNYAGDSLATGPYICEVIAKGSNGENRRYTAFALVN